MSPIGEKPGGLRLNERAPGTAKGEARVHGHWMGDGGGGFGARGEGDEEGAVAGVEEGDRWEDEGGWKKNRTL